MLAEVTELGLIEYALLARLAMGEAELRAGKTSAGRALLEELEQESRARGFVLIARKAAVLIASP